MAHGPLQQFLIQPLIPLTLAGYDISFTNASLFMVLAVACTAAFQFFGIRRAEMIPTRFQSMVELSYQFVAKMVQDNIGHQGLPYLPFILSLFMFILMGNLLGLLPYGFTITSHIIVTLALSLGVFLLMTGVGLAKHGWGFFRFFWPHGVPLAIAPILIPIEVISYLIRPITLSVRLCANMLVGHILLKLFAGFVVSIGIAAAATQGFLGSSFLFLTAALPLIFNIIFIAFEVFVACIQAYIFAVLTCLYLHDALHLH